MPGKDPAAPATDSLCVIDGDFAPKLRADRQRMEET
jgi:hypothetical protein